MVTNYDKKDPSQAFVCSAGKELLRMWGVQSPAGVLSARTVSVEVRPFIFLQAVRSKTRAEELGGSSPSLVVYCGNESALEISFHIQ